ncbi:MAG: AI-2E family transporter [Gammaproteobacteria bacterium]|nr:AI-2E family transporter [Gammaproteobacteria bacterium]
MSISATRASAPTLLVTMAALVVVVAGLRAAEEIIVPFLLAVFIAVVCSPPLLWLERMGLPMWAALLVVVAVIVAAAVGLSAIIGNSIRDFTGDLPVYKERLDEYGSAVYGWLTAHGVPVDSRELGTFVDPGRVMQLAAEVFNSFGGVLTNAFLIFLTVVFILFETTGFSSKLATVAHDPERSLDQVRDVTQTVQRYLAIKTLTSAATGIVIGVYLWLIGVDYAALWGVLAFLLNYVPNIGSVLAAVPTVLVALVQSGLGVTLAAAAGYLVVNVVVGSVLEPRIMGRGLGLSTLVVFLSLVFWGWVLGPVGMFLSVPLTITVKVALASREDTRWIATLLGPAPAPAAEGDRGDDNEGHAA